MKFVIRSKTIYIDNKLLFAIITYLMTLFIVYYFVLSHLYAYSQMTYTPNYAKFGLSIALIALTIVLLPRNKNKPSTYLYFTFYIITYLPTMMFYWMADKPTPFVIYETMCIVVIALMVRGTYKPIIISATRGKVLIQIIFVFYVLFCGVLLIRNGGIHLNAILNDLYQVRSENNLSGMFGYILNWCAKSFMPFFFIYFFLKKKYYAVCFVSILQLFLFLSYGFKAFIMAVFMLFFISFLMRNRESFAKNAALSFSIANLTSIVLYWIGSKMLLNLFPYRTLFLPSQGQFAYYKFFTENEYLHFSEGSIGRLLGIEYPYSQQIGRIVNVYIFGPQKLSNGNTGVLSYGFADFGFFGMILAAVLVGIVFKLIDSSTRDLPIIIPVSAMAYQMFTLNDNSILICLNTGGIMWSIVMLMLLNSVYSMIQKENSYLSKKT